MREDIQQVKLEKLARIREFGMDPYPEKSERELSNVQALEQFEQLGEKKITLAGRVRSMRPMGGSAFANIEDESGKMQLFLNKGNMAEELFKLFVKNVELGDFVQVTGEMFVTKTEEKSLKVTDWKMISKNIRPIPTEHFGIKDEEELLRRRYLDLMTNPETRELFRKKNIFWQTVRMFLAKDGFLEVQNPVFEHTPGGADAEPFITHHNALDQDFYMRISLELALKRLLVGGYEKVFEIGRVFRNEGIDRHHLQEYDAMEFYASYWDLQKGIEFSENLYKEIVKNVTGGMVTEYEGAQIDWSKKFPVIDYFDAFKKETGLELADVSVEALRAKADELGIKYEKTYGKGRMIDTVYKKTVRQKMIQPCFLVGHPIDISPLAKKDPNNANKVLRFQIIAGTAELCNAFAELNDPIDQKSRFEDQMKLREAGDNEAQMIDEDFVEALEYGMPNAFGFGLSERLFSFIMDKSIRECVIFPAMKARE
jgi:lysyl-tRNA synthetase class 2